MGPLVAPVTARSGRCERNSKRYGDWFPVSRSRSPSSAAGKLAPISSEHQSINPSEPQDRCASSETWPRDGESNLFPVATPPKAVSACERDDEHEVSDGPSSGSSRSDRQKLSALWIKRQLLAAPHLTDDRWETIARILHFQTTSMRSGENRPPLTAAGLTTTHPRTDSMIARR